MQKSKYVEEKELAALAKKYRMEAGKTRAQAAREMGVKHPSIFHAEESPKMGYHSLRRKMIEAYSCLVISGPFYCLTKATQNRS